MIKASRLVTSVVVGSALAISGSLSAKSRCLAVEAIVSGDAAEINGVAATYNSKGLIDLTKDGVKGALQNANDCELSARSDLFELRCTWEFSAEKQSDAEAKFDDLLKRLDRCLPRVMTAQTPVQYIAEIETLRETSLTIDYPAGDALEVRLELDKFTSDGDLWVNVTFSN